ncbi:Fructosamine-3-kinase [Paraoerskovia marina]|uniref:Fructosamine-3-kinase n=1 Tax=Paraoerskovia marina TaxID=545619 RepID=A0A1H1TB93_9CELL|nr:fructosamine kinase family protein [Paraoerskovia marina]SDS57453.1 Fructosamine-3-kinase [Paraoerskovia marina]
MTDERGSTFRKSRAGAPAGFFEREAAGLAWIDVPAGPRVVGVRDVGPDYLDLERIDPATPDARAARSFGVKLARLHETAAPGFGAPPDGTTGDGFFGPTDDPLALVAGTWSTWPEFYAEARLRPVADQAVERGALTSPEADRLRRAADVVGRWGGGPCRDADPARVHGDLWSGNLLWTPGVHGTEAVLVDPAAHGGHRESDLAMLALFGAPHLDEILAGYGSVSAIPPGWERRATLHQLYPVAVHAVLFGGGYRARLAGMLDALGG